MKPALPLAALAFLLTVAGSAPSLPTHPGWAAVGSLQAAVDETSRWVIEHPEPEHARASLVSERLVRAAISALPALRSLAALGVEGCVGSVCGVGDDVWPGDHTLSIDLGGNDVYHGGVGGGIIGLHIDLSGNDQYLAPTMTMGANGPGLGIAVALELGGDDVYRNEWHAQGNADGPGSLGLLVDTAGDDVYTLAAIGQGSLSSVYVDGFGMGALLDFAGNDAYRCGIYCQGYVYDGVGGALLLDRAGDDRYVCGGLCQGYNSNGLAAAMLVDGEGEDAFECAGGACQANILDLDVPAPLGHWSWVTGLRAADFG